MRENKTKIDKLIQESQKILVTGHKGPDDDAVSSVLAMGWYLEKYFGDKEVVLAFSEPENNSWDFLRGADKIQWMDDISEIIEVMDLVIFLDGTALSRFTNKTEEINLKSTKSVCIDHHVGEENGHTIDIRDITATANVQILAEILFSEEDLKDADLAETLLLGIYGDTGNMTYIAPEQFRAFELVGKIIQHTKINIQALLNKRKLMTYEEFEMLSELMKNTKSVEIKEGLPKLMYTYYPDELALRTGDAVLRRARKVYMRAMLRKVQDHPWGFTVVPEKDQYEISFRSTPGNPDVQKISSKYFGGGGHKLAAGGQLSKENGETVEKATEKILEILRNNDLKLTPAE